MKNYSDTETLSRLTQATRIPDSVRIVEEMRDKIHAVLIDQADETTPVRLEVELPELAPLAWLSAQDCAEKIYWSSRDQEFVIAGIGSVDSVTPDASVDVFSTVSRIESKLRGAPQKVRYFGGFRFDPSAPVSEKWNGFGAARFVLPRFELARFSGTTLFVCNLLPKQDKNNQDSIFRLLDDITFDCTTSAAPSPAVISRVDTPELAAWREMISRAAQAFADHSYEKIVLARDSVFKFSGRLEPLKLLGSLASEASECFHFCFQPDADCAFVGATPERLYFRDGRTFECEALAGTRPRGSDATEDVLLGDQLLESEKDMREHQYVVRGLRESLDRFLKPGFPENGTKITLRKLARVQHLVIQFGLQLRAAVTDRQIIEALHPTPAVGGYPREGMPARIAELEPFDRGWYAGPVGWISKDSAEFAVAIRSGLVRGDELSLYAGAGILDGSDFAGEWNELENKLGTFLSALNR